MIRFVKRLSIGAALAAGPVLIIVTLAILTREVLTVPVMVALAALSVALVGYLMPEHRQGYWITKKEDTP